METLVANPAEADTPAVLALAASYRHAIMNHLQVVLGWLQLGQPEKAERYIRILEKGLLGETRLVRSALPEVAATLILRRGRAEGCGIELTFSVPEGLRAFGWEGPEVGCLIAALIDGAILLLDRSPAGRLLEIGLEESEASRQLTLRLHEAPVTREAVVRVLEEVLAERGAAGDAGRLCARLAQSGGSWACGEGETVGVITVTWPKTSWPPTK